MDASTRFAKCFKITTENCKGWVLQFVKDRVCHLESFIKSRPEIAKHKMVDIALQKKNSINNLDITAICVIINLGQIVLPKEKASAGHVDKTVGDYIDRIRQIRNDLVHTDEAVLAVDDYKKLLNEFRDIAMGMERFNSVQSNTYLHEINVIDRQPWADQYVKEEIQLYRDYIKTVVLCELLSYDSYTKLFAAGGARTNSPVIQAVGGFCGGAAGLTYDIIKGGIYRVSSLGQHLRDITKQQQDMNMMNQKMTVDVQQQYHISSKKTKRHIYRQTSMDASTRFAKCFKITTENCKGYVLQFVKDKVCHFESFIKSRPEIAKHKMVAIALQKKNSINNLDITGICAIINLGQILLPKEKASAGHVDKTVGDYIDRIRQIRNDLVHTDEAVLEVDDYKKLLNEFRDIAMGMERFNNVQSNTYLHEINVIDRQPWADQCVKEEIQLYRDYIKTVVLCELLSNDSYTKTFAAAGAITNLPVIQAVGGFCGGTFGLSLDIFTGSFNGVSLLGKTLRDNIKRQRDNIKRQRDMNQV